MNLADKQVNPRLNQAYENRKDGGWYIESEDGITYKEALVLALAGNPALVYEASEATNSAQEIADIYTVNAKIINTRADAIIKELEK